MYCSRSRPCRTCYHEAGHAVAAYLTGAGTRSVRSQGARGGAHQSAQIGTDPGAVCMAGWAAERLAFGDVPVFATSDDGWRVGHFARFYEGDPDVEAAKMRATEILSDAWPAVECLARELVHHCTIAEGADRIIEAALSPRLRSDAAFAQLQAMNRSLSRAARSAILPLTRK